MGQGKVRSTTEWAGVIEAERGLRRVDVAMAPIIKTCDLRSEVFINVMNERHNPFLMLSEDYIRIAIFT